MSYIYCVFCGATPGAPTKCPIGRGGSHSFKESRTPVYCSFCGAIPGSPTKCPVGKGGCHAFTESKKSKS